MNRVSVEAELWALRYGDKVRRLSDDDGRKMMLMERMESGRDRWRKYMEGVEESLEGTRDDGMNRGGEGEGKGG